ncbi:MAG: 1,4-dihydroxy-2-naphthoate octaprenyltransferase [Bacteroidota bacterium]|jgi:1,4-dihydroxy-2-naphthoate octaprenyltransferase
MLKFWIEAARVRTLPLSLAGIFAGLALSPNQGNNAPIVAVGCIFTTIFFQVLSNFANDLGDTLKGTDNQNRIGPTRAVQSGSISIQSMKIAVALIAVFSLLSASILIGSAVDTLSYNGILLYAILAVLCVLSAMAYTLGKKAYGYFGLGDLMVLIFFGGVAVIGTRHLFTNDFSLNEWLTALSIGLWSAMVLNLNNMRDHENDANSHKNTLVVRFGLAKAKKYHITIALFACVSWLFLIFRLVLIFNKPFYIVALLPLVTYVIHLQNVLRVHNPKDFDPELKKVALSTFFSALLFYLASYF